MRKINRITAAITAVSLVTMILTPVIYTPVFAEGTGVAGQIQPEVKNEAQSDPEIMVSGNLKYKIIYGYMTNYMEEIDYAVSIYGVIDDSKESIDIPYKIDGKLVTCINNSAFENCINIKKIKLPNTIDMIGDRAFYNSGITEITIPRHVRYISPETFGNCKNLECIDLKNSMYIYPAAFKNCVNLREVIGTSCLEGIGSDAFSGCSSLTKIDLPIYCCWIDAGSFSGCTGITELNIPDEIKSIEKKAFEGCTGISKLIIGESVVEIAEDAFAGCSSVKEVIIKSLNISYDFINYSDDTKLYVYSNSRACKSAKENKRKYILLDEENDDFRYIKSDDHITINSYIGTKEQVIIPETIEGLPVTQINDYAFEDSFIREIIIPDCVKSIGEYAFFDCSSLQSIKLPDGLTELQNHLFSGCNSLEKLEIPSSLENIYYDVFNECNSLKEINIPENVSTMQYGNIFDTCDCLESINVDENNPNFYSDDGVLYTKDNNKLICYPRGKIQESFVVPEGVQGIGHTAFQECKNLKNIKISGDNCSFSSLSFYQCPALVCVDIGKNEESVDGSNFDDCPSLKKIVVSDDNNAYTSQNGMLFNKDMTELIFCFPGYEDTECIVPGSVKEIRSYAFEGTENLRTVVIPEGIKTLDSHIFSDNNSINKIFLPDSLMTIDDITFYECNNLACVEFGKNIKEIPLWSMIQYNPNIREMIIKNPECFISDIKEGNPYFWKSLINGLTIFSYVNSSSEKYCQQNDINFSALNEENDDMVIYGDLDGDKSVDLSDIIMLSQYLLHDIDFNQAQKTAADVEYNGYVDIADLARLKQYIMKDDIKLGK